MENELVGIRAIAPRSDGVIAMLQRLDHGVRFVAADGAFLSFVGREGAGPGEFDNAVSLGWIADTLWVYDSDLHRVTFVQTDSAVVRTVNVYGNAHWHAGGMQTAGYSFSVESVLADGSLLAWIYGARGQSDSVVDGESRLLARVAPGPDPGRWTISHIVARIPLREYAVAQTPERLSMARPPFPNDVVLAVAPDGSTVAVVAGEVNGPEAGSIRISLLSNRGDTIYHRKVALPPVPIPDEVADRAVDRYLERARSESGPSAEATRRAAYVPEVYPPVVEALLGADGRLWIRGRLRDRGYWVFDAMGHEIGRVRLPGKGRILAADATHIWTAERDEYDVSSMVRYRIVLPGGGAVAEERRASETAR